MSAERRTELLENAARCFKENYSPFCTEELVKMNVTSDECLDLSDTISGIIKLYINEELEEDPIKRYIKSLTKTMLQIGKTRKQALYFDMDPVNMSPAQLTVAVKFTDLVLKDVGFLANFVRLETLRQVTGETS